MKIKLSLKLIVMVLCAFILAGTIGLYAGFITDHGEACDKYCKEKYGDPEQLPEWGACYAGCLFGSQT